MSEQLTVATLVTIPDPKLFPNCTLFFDTVRVGFPTAKIEVWDNNYHDEETKDKLKKMVFNYGFEPRYACNMMSPTPGTIHHADWINRRIGLDGGPLVIIDPDTIWWENCEDYSAPTVLAGHYVPTIYNEFSRTISYERLHTSYLWIRSCEELRQQIKLTYPYAHDRAGEYCPCDPFHPDVKFVKGCPMFWDTTSNLYNMIGGTFFDEKHLDKYTHVNSASFYDVMLGRVENKEAFRKQHRLARENPKALKGFWRAEDIYYSKMAVKAQQMLQRYTGGEE